jgi:choline dehydrogenase-like flavoprotein
MMPDMPNVRKVMPDEFDVIIVGTGAAGGTLANTIVPSGKRVLLP